MPNYTRPDLVDQGHEDDPKDWLASSLIFGRALSLLLKENEGIVVDAAGDSAELIGEKTVIVYCGNGMVHITSCEVDLPEGQMVFMDKNS